MSIKISKGSIPVPFALPERTNVHLILVGVGGTGGHVFDNVLRIAKDLKSKKIRDVMITAIDGDVVEEKNIERQNFFMMDIGKNKAEVLANRFGRAFGLEIGIVNSYLEDEEMFKEVVFTPGYFPIVVGCVDNHKTRQLIHKMFVEKPESFLWIDAGNSQFSGQVVCGFNTQRKLTEDYSKPHMFSLPSCTQVFPEILKQTDKFKSEISCDDMAVDNIQNISANILSSTCLFSMLNQLLAGDGLSAFMLRFNAKNGTVSGVATSVEELNKYN